MKNVLIGLTLLTGAIALATPPLPPTPSLVKSTHSGFVRPEWRIDTTCKLFRDSLEEVRIANGITTRTVHRVYITGDIGAVIREAAKGQIVKETAPTDGPITQWTAEWPSTDPARKEVIPLRATGSLRYENLAPAAATLINLLDSHCK